VDYTAGNYRVMVTPVSGFLFQYPFPIDSTIAKDSQAPEKHF